ncbi:hypothetical protein HAX54_031389, partial [Datura stramonium]|nr:hypothetical protein [Datura stramonium]
MVESPIVNLGNLGEPWKTRAEVFGTVWNEKNHIQVVKIYSRRNRVPPPCACLCSLAK